MSEDLYGLSIPGSVRETTLSSGNMDPSFLLTREGVVALDPMVDDEKGGKTGQELYIFDQEAGTLSAKRIWNIKNPDVYFRLDGLEKEVGRDISAFSKGRMIGLAGKKSIQQVRCIFAKDWKQKDFVDKLSVAAKTMRSAAIQGPPREKQVNPEILSTEEETTTTEG